MTRSSPTSRKFCLLGSKMLTVLGGNGFVGSEYCRLLEEFGVKFVKNERSNYNCETEDVINFISTVHNYNVHTNSRLDIETNLCILMKTLDSWRAAGGKGCYTLISSWFVYGQDSGYDADPLNRTSRGIPETDPCDPKGFYSITKRCAEQLLMSYCETFSLNYRILRLANVIGKDDKKVSAQKNALQYLLAEIAASRDIQLYDGGHFYRDFIDSRDCARAIHIANTKGNLNEIYNIGNGIPCDFRSLLTYGRARCRSNSTFYTIEQKEFHKKVQSSRSFYMDNTKLSKLGYTPNHIIYETISDIMESLKQ